jgi:cellulose biosynthesis protein BcsQ
VNVLKIITIVSVRPGAGQTSITVNLASGLARQKYRVLIIGMGKNNKLYNWLGVKPQGIAVPSNKHVLGKPILTSRINADLLAQPVDKADIVKILKKKDLDYHYLFLLPASKEDCSLLGGLSDHLVACTNLSQPAELEDLKALDNLWHNRAGKTRSISLLVLNKINTREWEHNQHKIDALTSYFGYEIIADPIHYCERIHDLPSAGRTIWELSQQNLQRAYMKLVDSVKQL